MFNQIAFLISTFAGVTWVNRILGAQLLITADSEIVSALSLTKDINFKLFTMPTPNLGFMNALVNMADWKQYTIWNGYGQYFMVFLYALSIALLLGLFLQLLTGALQIMRQR